HLTAEDFAALDQILADYDAEMDSRDASRWGELNTALHMRLYERAGQPRTASIVASLLQGTDRYTRMQLAFTDGRPRAQDDHTRLVAL
ncbi:FCD domain-containing protein, partial [Acinetobacter baumannii]